MSEFFRHFEALLLKKWKKKISTGVTLRPVRERLAAILEIPVNLYSARASARAMTFPSDRVAAYLRSFATLHVVYQNDRGDLENPKMDRKRIENFLARKKISRFTTKFGMENQKKILRLFGQVKNFDLFFEKLRKSRLKIEKCPNFVGSLPKPFLPYYIL